MNLKFVLEQLNSSELKAFSKVDITDRILVNYINLACIDLYTRFMLDTDVIVVPLETGKLEYVLDGSDDTIKKSFDRVLSEDEVSTIHLAIYNGSEIGLNDQADPTGVFLKSYDTVLVPFAVDTGILELTYSSNPPMLNSSAICDDKGKLLTTDTSKVKLPLSYLVALTLFVGYRASNRLSSDLKTDNNTYYIRYEAECKKLKKYGVASIRNYHSYNINSKGFK